MAWGGRGLRAEACFARHKGVTTNMDGKRPGLQHCESIISNPRRESLKTLKTFGID